MLKSAKGTNATNLCTAIALLASGAVANAQDSEENLDRWTEKLDFVGTLPDRPKLIGDRLVWDDRSLVDLCAELEGSFRKLAGRSEYMCRLPAFRGGTATAQNERGE